MTTSRRLRFRPEARVRQSARGGLTGFVFSVRCKESESPHAVTVYMLEPQTCQYILGVSPPEAEWSPRCGGDERKHVHHCLFVSPLWTRWNLPSYAGFSTPPTNTDFCPSPANANKSNGTGSIRRTEQTETGWRRGTFGITHRSDGKSRDARHIGAKAATWLDFTCEGAQPWSEL